VSGPTSKVIVVRNVDTSLCANTGAVALLVVNGSPAASGDISGLHSAIQTEAAPGARVVAIVHTVPRFNRIMCIRLGELQYNLDECELVTAAHIEAAQAHASAASTPATREWYAWNNLMPPGPPRFHITGEVQVLSPLVEVLLVPRTPQGVNPRVLFLDLHLVEPSGNRPPLVLWKTARYDKVNATYDSVQILFGSTVIAEVPVNTVV
jgi:hypothetical protein